MFGIDYVAWLICCIIYINTNVTITQQATQSNSKKYVQIIILILFNLKKQESRAVRCGDGYKVRERETNNLYSKQAK